MAPKRNAPPPPPPPPAASSEETASGSGSEEEEEEEEIAHSPPPAAPKSIAPPPQKDQESEASDEDEDGEEEDDDEEEEEEDEKASHVIPSSATKNLPPPPPTREESETSDEEGEEEEEEEADDEMPQTKPAPNQEMMEAKGAKRPSAPFQRTWSTDDEFRILEVLAAHRQEHGTLPQVDVLANALAGKLDNSGCSLSELQGKVKSLRTRHTKAVNKGALPSKDHDRRLYDLSKKVWPTTPKAAAPKVAANSGAGTGREPDEMCELYPYLAEEVKALQKAHPSLFKREFTMIDDSKARALDDKIKRQRHAQMKLHLRRHDLTKEVTKTLMELAE